MLELKLLGEVEVLRDGQPVALPPSRKTRALLAYLAATGRAHRRERLCSMFWEVPDDPRGSLRWSMSRLRAVIDDPGVARIAADRETVAFEPAGARVDLAELRALAEAGIDRLPTGELERAAALFRGEFLEGTDLPAQHDFQSWCAAEREDLRRTQICILSLLVERQAGDPRTALPMLRQLVQVDPFNEQARAELLRMLVAGGRQQEAESHFEAAERLFRDIGSGASGRLATAWRAILRDARGVGPGQPSLEMAPSKPPPPASVLALPGSSAVCVGRQEELDRLTAMAESVAAASSPFVVFLLGDPGIGKSRLAHTFLAAQRQAGRRVLAGSAYDTSLSPPLGPWSEAVGSLPLGDEAEPAAVGRQRLFAEVLSRLLGEDGWLTVLLLEDLQWADEASADLLHHVVRSAAGRPLLIVATARPGELADNLALNAVQRALRRDRVLAEIEVPPLGPEQIDAIVAPVAASADRARIVELSAGNPLYAEELARNESTSGLPRSLKEMVRDRIERLGPVCADVVQWASVIGPLVAVDILRSVAGLEMAEFLRVVERLERERTLVPVDDGQGRTYGFGHELVRQAIYTGLSAPRRRMMHLKIARTLEEGETTGAAALELAEHAAAGGDASMAARACVAAGRHSARLFAHGEAAALVRQGQLYAATLAEPDRVERLVELAEIEAGVTRHADPTDFAARLEQLAEQALDHDRGDHASRCYRMLAKLRWEGGAWSDAQRDTLRAELVSRGSDDARRGHALGEAARCLAMLERDLRVAESLALEADALGRRSGAETNAVPDALGLLRCHQGEFDRGREMFQRACTLARREGDRTGEFFAIEHALTLEIELCRFDNAARLCREAIDLAQRLPGGSDLPFARALHALCGMVHAPPGDPTGFDDALAELRIADAKHRLAFAAVTASRLFLDRGEVGRARALAEEALQAASAIDRKSDMVTAFAMLARIAAAEGDATARETYLDRLGEVMLDGVSEAALRAAESALAGGSGATGATP